ncbi:zinc finger protein 557-like isoform X13 [Colletes gigas]|uniref:zinc finger protein 557-like isoform X13 n=1 Tax=Colletes gigas TaxID=935657 RepID=UPI001C9B8B74|nr:zinc finger protein 557-like isoform X13 [Colletes gigas]
MSSLDYLDLCRLCLVKDRVSVPIFDGEGDVRQIFLKIAACLPVKVAREDKLPKKICDDCVYKVELFYQFWNTTVNAEKQLLQWLGEVGMEGKQGYVTNVLNPNVMKQEQSTENRLDGSVMQQVSEHQNNMGIGMMDNIGLGIPMIISNTNQQQQITSVPMDTSSNSAQNVQAVPGPSSQTTHNQISQNQTSSTQQEEEEESSEDEENSDDECDGDEGLPVKEESEEDPNSRTIEPTTFVNVSLACDEAGPSGLQQQKIADMPEIPMPQTADGDPKSGCQVIEIETARLEPIHTLEDMVVIKYETDICTIEEFEHQEIVTDTLEFTEEIDINLHLEPEPTPVKKKVRRPRKLDGKPRSKTRNKIRSKTRLKPRVVTQSPDKSKKRVAVYECDICHRRMRRKLAFLKHRENHERNPDEIDRCVECDEPFIDEDKLKKHMIKVHQKERPYECVFCNKRFKTKEFLKIHLKQHNKRFVCDICDVSKVSGYDLRLHKMKHNKEYMANCEICGKGFYTKQTLDRHMITHTGEKPFICKICKTPYASAAYLNTHMKSHGEREKFKCSMCDFESHWKGALKVHSRLHTGENLIPCEICGKTVSSKAYMQVHMRIHTGEKPHICEVCGKGFSVRKYLTVHLRTHTGEKPYECKVCQKRFTQHGTLNSHMKSHNEKK